MLLSGGAALALASILPISAIAANCTDVTGTAAFRLAGESLVAQSSTVGTGSLGAEDLYYAGRETQVLIAFLFDRKPDELPLVAGMLRETVAPPIPVEVQVFDIEGDQWTLLCTVLRSLNGNGGITLKVEADKPVQRLAIRYSAASLPPRARLVAKAYSPVESVSERFPPICRELDVAELKAGFVFRQTDLAQINPGESCRRRIVVRSSRDLLVSVREGTGTTITASFKPADSYAPFARYCEATTGGRDRSRVDYVVGLNPSLPILRDGAQLWAIDVEVACPVGPTVEVKIHEVVSRVGVHEVNKRAPVARDYGTPAYLTDLRLSCFSDLRSIAPIMILDQSRGRRPATGKGFLDLRILRRTGELKPHESMSVEKAVMYALSAWNRACLNCEVHTLALARVNGRLFMSSLLIEELLDFVPVRRSLPAPATRDVVVEEWSSNVLSSLGRKVPAYVTDRHIGAS